MAQNLVIGALPNYTGAAATAVTVVGGGAGPAGMPIANVKNDRPWEVGRIESIFPHECGIEVDFGVPVTVETVAVINPSWVPGASVRAIGVEGATLPPVRSESIAPDAILATVNVGAVAIGQIDEHPSAPDGDIAASTSEVDPWSIRVSFDTPSAAPAVGAGALATSSYQSFVLWVHQLNESSGENDFAYLKASLYEGGTFRKDLGTKLVTVQFPVGQLLIFPWSASDLQTADGSAVELLIECTPGIGSPLPPEPAVDAIAWECLHQSDLDAADLDTGWELVTGAEAEDAWGGTAVQEVDLPPAIWKAFLLPTSVRKVRLEFRDDGLGFFTNLILTPPRTPSGVLDVGMVMLGPLFEAEYNFAPGASLRCRAPRIGDEDGLTGSNRAVAAFKQRSADVELAMVPSASAHSLFARLDYASQGTAAFLVCLEPQATGTIARNTTFLAEVEEARGLIYQEGFIDGEPIRSMGYSLVEVL